MISAVSFRYGRGFSPATDGVWKENGERRLVLPLPVAMSGSKLRYFCRPFTEFGDQLFSGHITGF